MSGTSMDGIDASLIYTDGVTIFDFINNVSIEYPNDLKIKIKEACARFREGKVCWMDLNKLKKTLTLCNLEAVREVINKNTDSSAKVDIIGYHGQTVYHSPQNKVSVQLGDPKYLSKLSNIPVVFNFRMCDILNGGQGAPLTPIYHCERFRRVSSSPLAIVNIGGISNITCLSDKDIIAFDSGPGNCMIDDAMYKYFSKNYDNRGQLASDGNLNSEFLDILMRDEFFNIKPPKSLDRYYFHKYAEYVEMTPQDLVCTLSYFTANTIVQGLEYLPKNIDNIIICGGGSKNDFITNKISELSKKHVIISDSIGINSGYIESEAFAYLAVRCFLNLNISYPKTTGIEKAMSGGSIFWPK